jgi:hypothetical protein
MAIRQYIEQDDERKVTRLRCSILVVRTVRIHETAFLCSIQISLSDTQTSEHNEAGSQLASESVALIEASDEPGADQSSAENILIQKRSRK